MAVPIKEKIKTIVKLLVKPKTFNALVSQMYTGYLIDEGWFNAFQNNIPVNKFNEPIPWFTYSSIDFIENRLSKSQNLFEFGSGNSTIYFASKVKNVVSIEHNKKWYEKVKQDLPHNVKIIFVDFKPDSEYCRIILSQQEKYDIIIIDAVDRVRTIKNSINSLSEKGIIILDDSERKEYEEGINFLLSNGFKRIDFWGIAPCVLFKKCTSIFYKNNNCLGI